MSDDREAGKRHRLAPLVLVSLSMLGAACVKSQGGAAPTPTASASIQETIATIGQRATTGAGNVVTVYSYVSPVHGARSPKAGMIFSAVDIQACAGPHAAPGTSVSRSQFALETPDQIGWASVDPVKTPPLANTTLKPNQCVRGWITFQLPPDEKPRYVVLLSSNIVKWQIS